MRVLIKSSDTRMQEARKNPGTKYYFQSAALDSGKDFPSPFEIIHDDPKKAYPPGQYEFAADAIYVAQSGPNAGRLQVSTRLVPLKSTPAKVA